MGNVLAKIVKTFIFSKMNLPCWFTNEETGFISFKDLSCRSTRIFRQQVIEILATQNRIEISNNRIATRIEIFATQLTR